MISRGTHGEGGMSCADALGERRDHFVIRAAAGRRVDRLGRKLEMLVTPRSVEVVVLEEHGRRQNDVGVARGVGHELLVHADEQVFAGETAPHLFLMRGDRERIGVLDEHRLDRRPVLQRLRHRR